MAGSLVVASAESHLRVDENVVASLGHVSVESAVNDALFAQHYRLKIVLFPLGVPVLALNLLALAGD